MLDIYIARHGQNEDNVAGILNGHRDLPLTDLGRGQALELAAGIKAAGLTFRSIWSSPLSRAYETAEIVGHELGMHVGVDPDLIERDFGVMTGKPIADIERLCAPDILKTPTITYFLSPPGAETFPQLLVRAELVLMRRMLEHSDGAILLVTHGDIGKMLYAKYYGLEWQKFLPKFHFGNSELLMLSPSSSSDEAHVIKIQQHNH